MNNNDIKDQLYKKLTERAFLYKLYLRLRSFQEKEQGLNLNYKIEDLNSDYYNKIKNLGDSELEHNIGRLTNFKEIIKQAKKLKGDFIEFGTWRGFSLLWIAYLMERNAIFDRKLFGIDGFIGLPYSDGVFPKHAFANTSYDLCKKNIYDNKTLYPIIKKNIFIAKYLFKQEKEILEYLKSNNINKFAFLHIDCDVSDSLIEIMDILQDGNLIADKAYILFDDYGCESNFSKTVNKIFIKMASKWEIKEHSSTKLTKNYYLEKKRKSK